MIFSAVFEITSCLIEQENGHLYAYLVLKGLRDVLTSVYEEEKILTVEFRFVSVSQMSVKRFSYRLSYDLLRESFNVVFPNGVKVEFKDLERFVREMSYLRRIPLGRNFAFSKASVRVVVHSNVNMGPLTFIMRLLATSSTPWYSIKMR